MERKLTVIFAADVVGYSRLVAADEEGTLAMLATYRATISGLIAEHAGRIFGSAGDSLVAEFNSAVKAVRAAIAIQRTLNRHNADLAPERRMEFRIGLHLGDVVIEGTDLLGDGVNIAARLQEIAQPEGICISGALREQIEGKLDTLVMSIGDQSLKNMPRPVAAYEVDWRQEIPATPKRDKPSRATGHAIAVLPFDNMSGDPGQQYLSDGITEDLITELSRFRGLAVAARHASVQFGSKGAGIAEVARALAVDYVVEGSVRRTGDRLRITVQLIDAASGSHVWAERYDRQASDVFGVLDEVVAAIAANLEDRVVFASAAQARRRPTESWTAYDYLLQGRELCNVHREPESVPLFERAIVIDPDFARAHAWLGLALTVSFMFEFDPSLLARGIEAGRRALALDANEATGHWACAMGLTWQRQLNTAGRHFERAIALNPADLQIRADRANWLCYCGRSEDALAAIDEALRQGPLAPSWFRGVRGQVMFNLHRYAEAIAALDNMPDMSVLCRAYLVAAHWYSGDVAAAAEAIAVVRRERPGLSVREIELAEPFAKRSELEHLLDGLRLAGLEA